MSLANACQKNTISPYKYYLREQGKIIDSAKLKRDYLSIVFQ